MSTKFRAAFATVGGLVMVGAMAVPAQAKPPTPPPFGTSTWKISYSKSHCFSPTHFKRGLVETLSGKVRYVRTVEKRSHGGVYVLFHDPTLIDPKVDLKVFTKCGSGRKTAKLSKAQLSQIWYDWKCKTSIGIFPSRSESWGIAIFGSYQCGRTLAAKRMTDYGKGSHFLQNNSGAPIKWKWGSGKRIDRGGKICLHADGGVIGWVGNTSDDSIQTFNVCVPASYAAPKK